VGASKFAAKKEALWQPIKKRELRLNLSDFQPNLKQLARGTTNNLWGTSIKMET